MTPRASAARYIAGLLGKAVNRKENRTVRNQYRGVETGLFTTALSSRRAPQVAMTSGRRRARREVTSQRVKISRATSAGTVPKPRRKAEPTLDSAEAAPSA